MGYLSHGGARATRRAVAAHCVSVLLAALLFSATPGAAQERAGWSYRLAHEVMSPYCPGLTLADCPSGQAAELRAWIVEREREGASREDVEALLFARYGEQLRQTPAPEGVGLLAYAAPFFTWLAGGVLLWLVFSRVRAANKRARRAGAREAQGAHDAELARQIDAELAADPR